MSCLGNQQRAQLNIVPHLKSLLVSLSSNQVLLDPDYYCWQTPSKASLLLSGGTTDHRLELNIFGSGINNKTPTQKNPACVICGASQNENKSSVLSAMDPPWADWDCCWMISFRFLLLRKESFKRYLHLLWIVALRKYSRSKNSIEKFAWNKHSCVLKSECVVWLSSKYFWNQYLAFFPIVNPDRFGRIKQILVAHSNDFLVK